MSGEVCINLQDEDIWHLIGNISVDIVNNNKRSLIKNTIQLITLCKGQEFSHNVTYVLVDHPISQEREQNALKAVNKFGEKISKMQPKQAQEYFALQILNIIT